MKERAGGREGEREREGEKERRKEGRKDMGTQALMEQRYFISKNAGLHIFSKMITQLFHSVQSLSRV